MGNGIDKFKSILGLSSGDDEDYDSDDLFDDEIDMVEPVRSKKPKFQPEPKGMNGGTYNYQGGQAAPAQNAKRTSSGFGTSKPQQAGGYEDDYSKKQYKSRPRPTGNTKVVSMNGRGSEVYVIKPQDFNEAQTVTDFLKDGKAIIINMEGIELSLAQRIIDFIGGATYALDGSLQAISGNIFVAAPADIEVSGDLREELLNDSTISPNLGAF